MRADCKGKLAESQEIARQVEEFLKRGGRIRQEPIQGVTEIKRSLQLILTDKERFTDE